MPASEYKTNDNCEISLFAGQNRKLVFLINPTSTHIQSEMLCNKHIKLKDWLTGEVFSPDKIPMEPYGVRPPGG